MSFLRRFAMPAIFSVVLVAPAAAANPRVSVHPRARIVEKIDDAKLTPVAHSHSSRLGALTETGRVAKDAPMRGLSLVLKSSDEQEYALVSLLDQQQKKGHENYRQWMTPQTFGATFGVETSDIAQVTAWLKHSGFTVDKVANGGRIIQFSGNAGSVETAFHTEMHTYLVNGEVRVSNSTDISIPTALTPVVRGVARLNNFRLTKPSATTSLGVRDADGTMRAASAAAFASTAASAAPVVRPLFTNPAVPVSQTANAHYVGGADYAAIYDTTPLLNQGINGTGVSIGLVESSDILPSDVAVYRNIFGLPVNQPTIIHVGPDSGVITNDDVVSNADVIGAVDAEVSGALAPMASVYYVVSGTSADDYSAVDNSAVYLVDNNLTDIISMNFGQDETESATDEYNGNGIVYAPYYENGDVQFFQVLWEQAAAQGQSVFVTSGVGGPDEYNIANAAYEGSAITENGTYSVNMYASTGFNVAVGSTEFNEAGTAYSATTGAVAPYWLAPASGPPYETAIGYIPENAWNQSLDGTINGAAIAGAGGIYSSGGGVSAYNPIPSWQINPSITPTVDPQPGTGYGAYPSGYLATTPGPHRLLPDVSMASGTLHDGTIVCYEGNCTLTSAGLLSSFSIVTGVSASTASMAGIQALINQANGGRQGNPNFYYYPIAAAENLTTCNSTTYPVATTSAYAACGFHDITAGNTYIPANKNNTSQIGWAAGPGYDLTTGLGSPDAANLSALWKSVKFQPTTVGLNMYDADSSSTQVSPIVISHGDEMQVSINVYPVDSTGTPISGTPTGDVGLIAVNTAQGGIGFYSLAMGGCANYIGPTVPITGVALTATNGTATTGYLYTLTFTGNVALGNVNLIPTGGSVTLTGLTGSYAFLNGTTQFVAASTATTFTVVYASNTTVTITGTSTGTATPGIPTIGEPDPSPAACGGSEGDGSAYDALNNGSLQQSGNFPGLPGGTYNVYAHYTGDTTYASSNSQLVAVTVAPELTTLEIDSYSYTSAGTESSSPISSLAYGTNLFLDADIFSTSGYGTPTGTVTFTLNNGTSNLPPLVAPLNSYGGAELLAGPGVESFGAFLDLPASYPILPVGTYAISATYSGDASFSPSTAQSFSITVTPAVSKVTLTNETADIAATGTATLLASVANAGAAIYSGGPATLLANGSMAFVDTTTSTALGTCAVVNGTCTFTTTKGAISTTGAHSIVATFTDTDGNYTSGVASKAATVTVVAGTATTITLAAPTTYQVGGAASLVATVGVASGTKPTSGTVAFYANGAEIGTATVGTTSTATLSIATLAAGSYTVTATYGGTTTYAASVTAAGVPLTITQNTPTVILTAAPTGDTGAGYSMQAVLKASPNNFGKSTPPVPNPNPAFNFYQGTTLLGTANASIDPTSLNFVANYTSTAVPPGPGTISATFVGDSNYATATATETVSLGLTSVGVKVTSPALSAASPTLGTGESIILQATVTPLGYSTATLFCTPLATTPVTYPKTCGTVSFYDNGTLLGSAETLPATATSTQTGVATLITTLPTSATTHAITTTYSGDTHFYTSNTSSTGSSGLGYTITSVAAGFTISSNPAAVSISQGGTGSVAITATVVGNWTGQAPLVCSGLPANATCTFSYNPNSPSTAGTPLNYFTLPGANGSGYTGTLTISSGTAYASLAERNGPTMAGLLWLPAIGFATLLSFRRRQLRPLARQLTVLAALLCASLATSACGSGTASTPRGTYNVIVTANGVGSTAASPTIQTSTTVSLSVN